MHEVKESRHLLYKHLKNRIVYYEAIRLAGQIIISLLLLLWSLWKRMSLDLGFRDDDVAPSSGHAARRWYASPLSSYNNKEVAAKQTARGQVGVCFWRI